MHLDEGSKLPCGEQEARPRSQTRKWPATGATVRARPVVQVQYETEFTSSEYVSRQGWRGARLERCPLHPGGGCRFHRHGTYSRVEPPGALITRYYCRKGQTTFSLLPDCLACRLSSSLDEIEQVVVGAEGAASQEEAAARLRPDIELPGALRWMRRRLRAVQVTLVTVATLLPGRLGEVLRLISVRAHLGQGRALVALRRLCAAHLQALLPPVGLSPRPLLTGTKRRGRQQETGRDPPGGGR